MAAIPKRMSIKTACRLLRCANHNQLAHRIGARQGTVHYWKKSGGGMVPDLWRDRIELILNRERAALAEVDAAIDRNDARRSA
jgi:predicted secreted protein